MGFFTLGGRKEIKENEYQVTWPDSHGEGVHAKPGNKRLLFAPEWAPQSGVQLTWPHAGTDWKDQLPAVTACFLDLAREISRRERVFIVAPEAGTLHDTLQHADVCMENVRLLSLPTNDTWARDHGALTLVGGPTPVLLDFRFNGWGEKFPAEEDNRITRRAYRAGMLHGELEDHLDFIFEGGSIETDGKGTLLTTTHCLMAPHRNTRMNRQEVERYLLQALRSDRVLWLDYGSLEGDDTDGHIDTLARLCPDHTITYVQCSDPTDSHYMELKRMEQQLQEFRTTDGLPYRLLPLPMADPVFEDGERLPATYANYLVINGAVLYPTYHSPEKDAQAGRVLKEAFPGREIIGIDCRTLISQHGSLHCVTMQYPEGVIL